MAYLDMSRRQVWQLAAGAVSLGVLPGAMGAAQAQEPARPLPPDEAKRIAREAYIYAFPIAQNYLTIYQFALDPTGSQYKGPPNEVHNVARVFTPADTAVITVNSDTPYSFLVMDLRAEPLVVTLPKVEANRYYSLQLVDLYTHNVDYIGTRTDGNDGGDFLVAGPDWNGATPAGIKRLVRIPTQLMYSQFRTQLFDPADMEAVKRIQQGYKARPLSAYLNQASPPQPPRIDYPPINTGTFEPQFWQYVNFLLQFCPTLSSEQDLRAQLARIGVGPGLPWPPAGLSPEVVSAIEAGRQEARKALEERLLKTTTSVGLFGTPQEMAGKYMERAIGARGGIYGNSTEETVYPSYVTDETGQRFDAGTSKYTLRFAPGQLPPVNAFWSVTMYDANTQLLVDNPLDRYLINSPMLPNLRRDPDGGITLYLQHASPGAELEANWLPAPNGPMSVVMRLYLPKPEVISGQWTPPPIRTAGLARP